MNGAKNKGSTLWASSIKSKCRVSQNTPPPPMFCPVHIHSRVSVYVVIILLRSALLRPSAMMAELFLQQPACLASICKDCKLERVWWGGADGGGLGGASDNRYSTRIRATHCLAMHPSSSCDLELRARGSPSPRASSI